ncbi:MAG: hypothetical protein E7331_05620 [Clostridiales bacterium]|nr:hypothetical protein [Clostridiales bacterium]
MKKTVALLLGLALCLGAFSAGAEEIKIGGLTLDVPEEYAVFLSEKDESTVLTLQKGDVVYSITSGKKQVPELELLLIYRTVEDGFYSAIDPAYTSAGEETLFIGQTEVHLSSATVKAAGQEAQVMCLCMLIDGDLTVISVMPLDGSAPDRAAIEEMLTFIKKPKFFRKGLTEEPVK